MRFRTALILSLILATLLPGFTAAAQGGPQAFSPDVVAELQAAMDALTADGLPPGMVVWIDAPDYQFAGASGFADLKAEIPLAPEGAFRIGSITKLFTATVIIRLAEEGALTLDDPLAQWLPDVAAQLPYGDAITLRHLLTHTSGVFHYVDNEAYYTDLFTKAAIDEATGTVTLACAQQDPQDTLARYVYGRDAYFAPGAGWHYSNTNYTLLGMVIEAAAKMPLAAAYHTYIYEPLGMPSTFLDCYEDPVVDVVHGYMGVGDTAADVTDLHESIGWAAGGLVSTAPDLITFARGLFGGALFADPASLAAMTTPAPGSTYGLGIMLQGGYQGHLGGIAGFLTLLNYAPALDTVVVTLYNTDSADPEQGQTAVLNPVLPLLRAED